MKQFFTYEQQIEKLKHDNLIISNEATAQEILKREGYYNVINGYSPIFKTDNRYYDGTTFEQILALYNFDKKLRYLMYKAISVIECHIKAVVAHEFSRVHGVDENAYLQPSSFASTEKTKDKIADLIKICNDAITEAINIHSNRYRKYIAHHKEKHNHVPMWVLIRALTFGTTSIFYKYMLKDEQDSIASIYNLTSTQLTNILEIVVSFRNIVAHGERTYCARLPKARLSTNLSVVNKLGIAKKDNGANMYGRNDFLSLLICCKYLLNHDEFSSLINEFSDDLAELNQQIPQVLFAKVKTQMGLKTNSWKNLIKIEIN